MTEQPAWQELAPNPMAVFTDIANRAPTELSMLYGHSRLRRCDVLSMATGIACRLAAQGVGLGDRVIVIMRNSPVHLAAFLATSWLGAVLVPLNFRLALSEIHQIIDSAAPLVLIGGPSHAADLGDSLDARPDLHLLVVDDDPLAGPAIGLKGTWQRLSAPAPISFPARPTPHVPADRLALLLFTSGSSGQPKAVKITHGNLDALHKDMAAVFKLDEQDVSMVAAPFGHVGGFTTFSLQTLLLGGTVVILPRFRPREVLADMERFGVTRMFGVPSMYGALATHPDFTNRYLDRLRTLLVGGAPVPTRLQDDYQRRGIPLTVSWGMTELCGGGTWLRPEEATAHSGSVGLPFPLVKIRLTDQLTGEVLTRPGAVGELQVRSQHTTSGYWGDDHDPCITRDGWLQTGDLAIVDSEGYLYLVGRSKDVIISGGENIYPGEVERIIRLHPTVADVAVIGMASQEWGETPIAFVIPARGATVNSDELKAFVCGYLARYKAPSRVLISHTMPTGPSGKPDWTMLRHMAEVQLAEPPATQ